MTHEGMVFLKSSHIIMGIKRSVGNNNFSAKKLKLLSLRISLCIWQDFICVMKVTGAMWIMSLWGASLCLSSIQWEKIYYLSLGKF